MAADETTDDPIDGWRKANRLSIRCVLVTGNADPGPALAAAGIFDPVAIPVVLGDRPDLPGGILGDGRTPNLTGTLEFDQPGAFGSPPGAQRQPAQSVADGGPPSGPVTTTVPPAFGMKSLAPIRVRAPIPSRISHSRQTPNPTSPAQPADAPDGAAPKDPVNDVVHDRLTSTEVQLADPRVRAFLGTISEAEGAKYNSLYGGGTFSDYSTHPPAINKHSPAGAYQITIDTWKDVGGQLGLNDFSPHTQDLIAARLLANEGSIRLIEADDIEGAVQQATKRWSSLPGASQPRMSAEMFLSRYKSNLFS